MKNTNKDVGERLLELLENKGYNVNSFASLIQVDATTLHYITKGKKNGTKSNPSFKIIQKLSKTFNEKELYWLISGQRELKEINMQEVPIKVPIEVPIQDKKSSKVLESSFNCEGNTKCATYESKELEISKLKERISNLEAEKLKLYEILDKALDK